MSNKNVSCHKKKIGSFPPQRNLYILYIKLFLTNEYLLFYTYLIKKSLKEYDQQTYRHNKMFLVLFLSQYCIGFCRYTGSEC